MSLTNGDWLATLQRGELPPKGEVLQLFVSLSLSAAACAKGTLVVSKLEPRPCSLLRRSSLVRATVTARGVRGEERAFVWDLLASERGVEPLSSNPNALIRAFAEEAIVPRPEHLDELAALLSESLRLSVEPLDVIASPDEGIVGQIELHPERDGSVRRPASPAAFSLLLASTAGPRWEGAELRFARADVVVPGLEAVVVAIREVCFAFPAPGQIQLVAEITRDFVELILDLPHRELEESSASGRGTGAAGEPHPDGVPDPGAQARFDSRWSWLGARKVGGERGGVEVRVPGVPSAREAPPAEAVAMVHAWQARLEATGSRDVPHELGPAARAADDRGGEDLVGMRLVCAFALHLLVQPSFGAANRTWMGLLGPRGLARLTRTPEALASLTALEPRWVLEHSVTSGERCLVTLLAEAMSPVLAPSGTFPYGGGILTRYTLDKMDEGRGDFQWAPENNAEWKRLRAALDPPRVTEEGGWLHVVFCRGELGERVGERLALMDLERHDYWLEPLTGELRGRLSTCGSVVCREPSMPMIGRPFVVQRRLVTARAVARADWSAALFDGTIASNGITIDVIPEL